MRYFKTELSLPATLLAPPREPGYRRTLRYGHARLRSRAVDRGVRDPHTRDANSVRLIPLPRVQAVVDAMLESMRDLSSIDAHTDTHLGARVA